MTKAATPSGVATRSDPLVSFRRDRLQAALRAWRISESALATQVGVAPKTINDLVKRTRRGRRSVLDAISNAVQVPLEWLTGESDRLPLQPFQREGAFRALGESQFILRCVKAYERDTRRSKNDAEEWTRRRQREGEFVFALYVLMDHRRWGREFLRPVDWDVIPPGETEVPVSGEMEARLTEAVIAAVELLLKPWLDGVATLDYQKLIAFATRS